jgi:hypothetical protein
MDTAYGFSGTICAVSRDGRSGVVQLDAEVMGKTRAVISPDTIGRISLMGEAGILKQGTLVMGTGHLGNEALRACVIAKAPATAQPTPAVME